MIKTTKTSLLSAASALGVIPTTAERAAGRLMRAPDGHDAGGAAAADGSSGAAGADQGGEGGADGAASGGEGGDQSASSSADGDGKPETILGEAAADGGGGDDASKGKEGGEAGEGEGAKEEEKDGDQAVEVLGAPEKYELTVPEALATAGVTFDQEAFDAVEPILRELNLSNDAAQALTNAYAEKVLPLLEKRAGERWDTQGADMRKGWETEARGDPEIGGAKFDETKALAKQTFVRFGVKADGPFLKLLEESGLGSHPDMLRFVANVGRLTGEASVDQGSGGAQPPRLADRIYGKPVPRD